MSQQQEPATFRYSFTFGASPDLAGRFGDSVGYVVRHAVNGEEQKPLFIQSTHEPSYSFDIEVPEAAVVTILLSARDEDGNSSKAVPYEYRATAKRIIRHPGAAAGSLAMTRVHRPIRLKVVNDEPAAAGGCGSGCGCSPAAA